MGEWSRRQITYYHQRALGSILMSQQFLKCSIQMESASCCGAISILSNIKGSHICWSRRFSIKNSTKDCTCKIWRGDHSNLRRVTNMNTSKILPVSCRYSLGLFSPRLGTPGKRERASARDSAKTRSRAPMSARFLKRNCMSHKML